MDKLGHIEQLIWHLDMLLDKEEDVYTTVRLEEFMVRALHLLDKYEEEIKD